jgi:hypothetical protein
MAGDDNVSIEVVKDKSSELGTNEGLADLSRSLWSSMSKPFKADIQIKEGAVVIKRDTGVLTMEADGVVMYTDYSSGRVTVTHPGGTILRFDDRGEGGPPSSIKTPGGREAKMGFSTDHGLVYRYQFKAGDSLEDVARDLLMLSNTRTTNYTPTDREISDLSQTLKKANHRPGDELNIPASLVNKAWMF